MTNDRDALRAQLIEAMGFISEDRYCTWMPGLSQVLHEEAGIWEIVGREVGWPVGDRGAWTWVTWDEAADIYCAGRAA